MKLCKPVNMGLTTCSDLFRKWSNKADQVLSCHDQVSSGKYLAFFNLWHDLHMFLDTMEPRTEDKNQV